MPCVKVIMKTSHFFILLKKIIITFRLLEFICAKKCFAIEEYKFGLLSNYVVDIN